jgi:hypothetical protein
VKFLKDLYAAVWLAWHWKELRHTTRDSIFQDMRRIKGHRRRLQRAISPESVAEIQENFRMIQDLYDG